MYIKYSYNEYYHINIKNHNKLEIDLLISVKSLPNGVVSELNLIKKQ